MHAEYPIVNDGAQGEKVKHVGKVGPDVRVAVLAHAFSVEAVRLACFISKRGHRVRLNALG